MIVEILVFETREGGYQARIDYTNYDSKKVSRLTSKCTCMAALCSQLNDSLLDINNEDLNSKIKETFETSQKLNSR